MVLRILMVNEFFSYGDGSSLYLMKMSETLASKGLKIDVLYGTKRLGEYHHPAITTHFVPDIFGFDYVTTKKGLKRIKEVVLACRPDIIYIHQVLNPRVIDLLTQMAPAVRYEHGFRLSCPTGRRRPEAKDVICQYPFSFRCMVRAYTQRCMPRNPVLAAKRIIDVYRNIAASRKLKKIIVASAYIKRLLVQSRFHPDSIAIIPYFVEVPEISRRPPRKNKKPSILFIGRIVDEKGADLLLQALPKISIPSAVTIIGEGPGLDALKKMATGIPGHEILFPGWVDNESLHKYYTKADLLVAPSIWPEPFGIIGIEAMSFGVPVVAFDVGGISDWLIHGENGFLVERKDISGLAEKIQIVIADRHVARTMGLKGRERVENNFTLEIHLNRLNEVFNDALDGR